MADDKARPGDEELWERLFAAALTGVIAGHGSSQVDGSEAAKQSVVLADGALEELRRRRADPTYKVQVFGGRG